MHDRSGDGGDQEEDAGGKQEEGSSVVNDASPSHLAGVDLRSGWLVGMKWFASMPTVLDICDAPDEGLRCDERLRDDENKEKRQRQEIGQLLISWLGSARGRYSE